MKGIGIDHGNISCKLQEIQIIKIAFQYPTVVAKKCKTINKSHSRNGFNTNVTIIPINSYPSEWSAILTSDYDKR